MSSSLETIRFFQFTTDDNDDEPDPVYPVLFQRRLGRLRTLMGALESILERHNHSNNNPFPPSSRSHTQHAEDLNLFQRLQAELQRLEPDLERYNNHINGPRAEHEHKHAAETSLLSLRLRRIQSELQDLHQTLMRRNPRSHPGRITESNPTSTAAPVNMPIAAKATRKRPATRSSEGQDAESKRQRVALDRPSASGSAAHPTKSPKRLPCRRPRANQASVDDPFASDKEGDQVVINLTGDGDEAAEVAKAESDIEVLGPRSSMAASKKPKEPILTRLAAYQCVICMDDVTDMMVTDCGHVFCSECLHSALHIDSNRKICPICRQKLNVKPVGRNGARNASAPRGAYALEFKLVSRSKLGKMKSSTK